jgi:alpha-beta hydrolase superfamily lysophospholipase
MMDGNLEPSDRRTPWCYAGDPRKANAGVFGIGTVSTCRSWLNMWSLTDSDCRAGPHLARMHLPSLVIQAKQDAGVFPSQAREIYDGIAATDKRLEELDGDHYFQEPSGARDQVADLIAAWLDEH